jgi:CheY-specific phosphatase CheX
MNDFYKDAVIGVMFTIGVVGFISGEFIISTVLFGAAAIFSNVEMSRRLTATVGSNG